MSNQEAQKPFNKSDFYKILSMTINLYMPTVISFLKYKKYEEFDYSIINDNLPYFKFISMLIYNDFSKAIDYNIKILILGTYDDSILDEDLLNVIVTPKEAVDFHLYKVLEQTILKIIERNIAYYFSHDKTFYPTLFLDSNGRILNKIKNISNSFSKYTQLFTSN